MTGIDSNGHGGTASETAWQSLRERELLCTQAMRIAHMGSWSFDVGLQRLWWSPETCALFGMAADEMAGQLSVYRRLVLAEDLPGFDAAHTRASVAAGEGGLEVEFRIRRADGAVRWMFERGSVERDASGIASRWVGLVMDITERKLAEQQRIEFLAREQSARKAADAALYYRSLFESAPGCYLVLSPDAFTIEAASEAYLRATMTTREQIAGRALFEVFPDDPSEPTADGVSTVRASLERVKITGETDVVGVLRYPIRRPPTQGGGFEERFWSILSSPVRSPEGKLAYIIHRIEDVTEYIRHQHQSGTGAAARVTLALRAEQLEVDIALRSQELRRASDRLEQDQAILRIAGRVAKVGGWMVSVPPGAMTWSDETAAIHDEAPGFSPASTEATARYFLPEHSAAIQRAGYLCGTEGTPFEFELPMRTAKSRSAWVRLIGEARRNQAGVITHVQGAFQDISEQHAASEEIAKLSSQQRVSEERFRLLTEATNDAVWDWNITTGDLWWNDPYAPEEPLADPTRVNSWMLRLHPDDKDAVLASVQRALNGAGSQWSFEHRTLARGGAYIHVLARGHILRDAAGKATRMIGGAIDLTERRLAEAQLRAQANLLDQARDAILVRDLEHRVRYWNQGAERLYGWTAVEATGRLIDELSHTDAKAFEAASAHTLATGAWVGELEQRDKAGHALVVECRWTLVRDDQGAPNSILCINTDITQRKKLESQVLRAQRMESIGALAGGIAHDLNNTLAPLLMTVSLLREDETDPGRQDDLAMIQLCAERGAAMVQQLLTFARGTEGRRSRTDLGKVAGELRKMVKDTFPKDITFRLVVPRELWSVDADATQMHQLLTNLCVNARDAMASGGTLTVALEQVVLDDVYAGMNLDAKPGSYVMVRVEDTGTGVAPGVLDRMFEPFFTTKETGKGTGLGLSTAHAIVRSHGGFIDVYSELGKGTRFRVYLPAMVGAATAEEVVLAKAKLPRGHGELVLLVDDEEPIRLVAGRTLEQYGYRVLVASNGAEAVAQYAQHRGEIAVVLTDMAMPVMDGPATIIALKRLNPRVLIIASSGLDADGKLAQAVGSGVVHFVPKPYTAETLLKALTKVLHVPSATPSLVV